MKTGDENEESLVGYLLGDLSEEEMTRVEERLFTSDEYYERLLIAEDDLRYDYLQGNLSERERLAFEKRFLPFAEDRGKLDFANALITKTAEIAAAKGSREKKPFRQSLSTLFSLKRPVLVFASAMAVIALAVSIWLAFETARMRGRIESLQSERAAREQELRQQTDLERARADALKGELDLERRLRSDAEKELAESQERSAREPRGLPAVISFLLAPGRTRAEGATAASIAVPQSAERLQLRLSLKTDIAYASFRAAILNADGKDIWNRSGLRSRGFQSGKIVIVSLPARLMAEDDYELKLSGETAADTQPIATYYFTVRQK